MHRTTVSFLLPIIIFYTSTALAQLPGRENLILGEVHFADSTDKDEFRVPFYDIVLHDIVRLNKFNVIDRSPEVFKAIEKELAMADFITSSKGVRLGEMLGGKYYIKVMMSHVGCEHVNSVTSPNNSNSQPTYDFLCSVRASLRIVNLETGLFQETVTASKTERSTNRTVAVQNAMEGVSSNLAKQLSKQFLTEAHIIRLSRPDEVVIDKGYNHGVYPQQAFVVPGDNSLLIKITSAREFESTGRVITGSLQNLAEGQLVKESGNESDPNIVKIDQKQKRDIVLTGGSDIGVKKGDGFVATEETQKTIGGKLIREEKVIGQLYVVVVKKEYAQARVIRGYYNLKPGMVVKESDEKISPRIRFLRAGYKSALGIHILPNKNVGPVTVTDGTATIDVDTKYLDNYSPINNVSIITTGFGTNNLAKGLATTFCVDIYNLSPLKTWIAYLDVRSHQPLIPERIFFTFGGSAGYGRLKQGLPNNLVHILSGGADTELKANSIFLSANAGVSCKVNRFAIDAGVSFDYLKFSNWNFDTDKKDGPEYNLPNEIVPYDMVNLTAPYYQIALKCMLGPK